MVDFYYVLVVVYFSQDKPEAIEGRRYKKKTGLSCPSPAGTEVFVNAENHPEGGLRTVVRGDAEHLSRSNRETGQSEFNEFHQSLYPEDDHEIMEHTFPNAPEIWLDLEIDGWEEF